MYQYIEIVLETVIFIVEDGGFLAMFVENSAKKLPVVGIVKQSTISHDNQLLIQLRIQPQVGNDFAPMSLLHQGSLLEVLTSLSSKGEHYKAKVSRRWFEPAIRASWQNMPIPDANKVELEYVRLFTQKEYDRIKLGEIPTAMEDHWFAYFEKDCLYWFRSWTGIGIFELYLEWQTNGWRVIKAMGNNDPAFDASLVSAERLSAERLSGLMDGLIWHGEQIFDI